MSKITEKWSRFISEADFDVSNLHPKKTLQPAYWNNMVLNTEIESQLLKIATDIVDQLELQSSVEDIVITGSMAGYNWHDLSDVDVHILLDFSKIDDNVDLVKKYLDNRRMNWNKAHKIMIKGHEVEIYFQDSKEKHESPGMYSLSSRSWLKEPKREIVDLDLQAIEAKAERTAQEIEEVDRLFNIDPKEAYNLASLVKDKVKRFRSAGLARDGINSVENLAFKLLRNGDFLSRLSTLKVLSYDKMMSLPETTAESDIKINIQENWRRFLRNE